MDNSKDKELILNKAKELKLSDDQYELLEETLNDYFHDLLISEEDFNNIKTKEEMYNILMDEEKIALKEYIYFYQALDFLKKFDPSLKFSIEELQDRWYFEIRSIKDNLSDRINPTVLVTAFIESSWQENISQIFNN